MEVFKDLVIQYGESDGEHRIAGVHCIWNRAMVISDKEFPDAIKNEQVAVVMPASVIDSELLALKQRTERLGLRVAKHLNSALGVAEFYLKQDAIGVTDKELIVVDVNKHFTEVCFLKNTKRRCSIIKTVRIDCGSDAITEWLLEMPRYSDAKNAKTQLSDMIHKDLLRRQLPREKIPAYDGLKAKTNIISLKRQDVIESIKKLLIFITASIDNLLYREQTKKPVILLSGRLWVYQEAIQLIKSRYPKHKLVSYRPEVAALLGCSYYFQGNSITHAMCSFADNYDKLHYKDIWGEVNRLSKVQQEGYWRILETVFEGRKEVLLKGNSDDLYKMYYALHIDFPEVCIIWSYTKSRYYSTGTKMDSYIKLILCYKPSGRKLLATINSKADEILRNCIYQNEAYSDRTLIQRIYFYISEHYHYTKDELSTGEYPNYAYTIETLMRCGVCHGYATSLIYLFRKLQIPILYVGGDADGRKFGGHAWNMIQTEDGGFRHLDITWDLEKARNHRIMEHYLLDDIAIRARRHFWNVQDYPACV